MIVSRENRRLKDIRRLRRCKDADRALLEGPHLILEAHRAGLELDYVLATPEFLAGPTAGPLLRELPRPPQEVTAALLDEVADADSPRGVVAAVRLPPLDLAALPGALEAPLLYAEAIQDPGNLGALARSAEAAGATGLCLSPATANPRHPRALRASAGSLLRLPTARGVTPESLRRRYAGQRPRFVALTPRGGSDLYAADLDGPLCVLVGSEGHGLTEPTLALADLRVTIPLAGAVESLNTAVAAALVLFEIARRARG